MYNSQLDVFIAAADCGSFNKAAEKLFISPTAVMKQINNLEKHIGIQLIERTAHGIHLTKSGEQFYKDAKFIINYSKKALSRIRQSANDGKFVIRVGTSVLNPCKILMDLWGQINDIYSHFKINVVPFEDDHTNILTVIGDIGKKFDFIVGACDSPQWLSRCNFLKLGEYKECAAVPRNHPLAAKKILKIEDLYGENLFMVARGISTALDRLHDELEHEHPQIQLEETSFYDIDVFNRCEQSGGIMLTLDAWAEVHPSLVTIPVDWD
ncbi:MAG: LysR family transcriptional regulator, partial [Candidatus Ornithomonoglobus sp.]